MSRHDLLRATQQRVPDADGAVLRAAGQVAALCVPGEEIILLSIQAMKYWKLIFISDR